MQPFVAALGAELSLTSKDIADIIWLALQMQSSDAGAELTTALDVSPPEPEGEARARPASPDFVPPVKPEKKPEPEAQPKSAELHQPNTNQPSFGRQLALKVPDARSLREPLSLARSLKPLLRRVVSGWSTTLDEAATVERIADEQLWLPVLKPALEPWLDLALLVDESISMQIWHRTIAELQRLLSHYGVFRDVRVWRLVTDELGQVKLQPGIGTTARRQTARRPSELIDPGGRRLILVATDCVSSGWQDGTLVPALKLWASSGPLAIVQMLPEWLWSRTGLGFASAVKLQSLLPGVPNQQLIASEVSHWDEIDLDAGIKVPVVTLEPEPFATWTEMVAGKGGVWSPGFVLEEAGSPNGQIPQLPAIATEVSAEQRVQRFRVTASPMARRLAGLLAAAPAISLPVVRIIQDQLLPESRQVHVAEVFLGGLLKPLGDIGLELNSDAVQYDFWDGVRELLLKSMPTSDVVDVVEEVSKFVATRLGLSLEAFAAVLRNPQQVEEHELTSQSRPFARVTAQILRQLSGEYAQFAEELESSNQIDPQSNTTNGLSGRAVEYQVGGCLPGDSCSYVVRQADKGLVERLKTGTFCYVFSPQQMGKSSLIRRTMMQLQSEGIRCGNIDFNSFGTNLNIENFYAGLVHELIKDFDLGFKVDLNAWWNEQSLLSPLQKLDNFIENVLLNEVLERIIIFLDEIDSILNLDFLSDFFGCLRAFNERKQHNPKYGRLTFVLFGVVNPSEFAKGFGSPFLNICSLTQLKGFQFHEALSLAPGLEERSEDSQAVLREILNWTGGQPFLTQKLCQLVLELPTLISRGTEKQAVSQLVRERIIENWEAQDVPEHLKTIRDRLLRDSENVILTLSNYQEILQKSEIAKDSSSGYAKLLLSGLVIENGGKLQVCNRIYETIFNQNWIDNELSKLRPYAKALENWLASNRQDKSCLLNYQQWKDTLAWVAGKNLSTQDYEFLSASRSELLRGLPFQQKVRIYELSRELDLDNRDLLTICEQLNVSVKSHSSTITEAEAELIRAAASKYTVSQSSATKSRSIRSIPTKKQQILEIRRPKPISPPEHSLSSESPSPPESPSSIENLPSSSSINPPSPEDLQQELTSRPTWNTAKVRVYELARELNLDNKDILTICEQLNISVKSHSSTMTEAEAARIRSALTRYSSPPKSAPVRPVAAPLTIQQNSSIYVGNLSFKATEEDLRTVFSEYGKVTRVTLPTDRETGQRRGFAFVEMATEAEANEAIADLDGAEWMGREMRVNKARPRENRRYNSASASSNDTYLNRRIASQGHLIHKLKAKDSTGRWAYYFVLIHPSAAQRFLQALESTELIELQDYGEVVASCYGESPDEETIAFLKERYGFDV